MENFIEMYQFPNMGYVKFKFTDEQLKPVRDEIIKIRENFSSSLANNGDLAGHIRNEYRILENEAYVGELMMPLVMAYDNFFGKYVTNTMRMMGQASKQKELRLQHVWVNFQEKHEFNPIHSHLGLLSFVIWMEIPFEIKSELETSPGAKANRNISGHFNFHFTDIIGQIETFSIPADKSYENTAVLFPAQLKHSVAPFYSSDKFRVSVAGNFEIVTI
jgi:hypothetical protein